MRRLGIVVSVTLALVGLVLAAPDASLAQQKKLVLWTHWDHSPEFNNWYATKGVEFAKKAYGTPHPGEVDVAIRDVEPERQVALSKNIPRIRHVLPLSDGDHVQAA